MLGTHFPAPAPNLPPPSLAFYHFLGMDPIRACVLRYKEPFPYVNLAYIAEGLGLLTAHEALLRKADSLPGQTVRFNANGTSARHRLAAAQGNDSIKKAIKQLCDSYL